MAEPPKLTEAEAAMLRWVASGPYRGCLSRLLDRGLVDHSPNPATPTVMTHLGRAALAAYDTEQRRAIRVEAMREYAKAVYYNVDAHNAIFELIAEEEE